MNTQQTASPECQALIALIPAYTIGATDPEEEAYIRTHLPACPEALAVLAEYTEINQAMHRSVAPVSPPAHILENVLAEIRQPAPRRVLVRRAGWLLPAAALIGIVLAVGTIFGGTLYWAGRATEWDRTQAALESRLADQARILAMVGAGAAQRIDIPVTAGGEPRSRATLLCSPTDNLGLLYVSDFPALVEATTYQVWLSNSESRVSVGLFNVDAAGGHVFVFSAPAPMESYQYLGVTVEPAGGSSGPTTPPVVRGQLYY